MHKLNPLSLFRPLIESGELLVSKLVPGWSKNKINELLLIPTNKAPIKVPRGFTTFKMESADGVIQAYHIGKGPTVVFVHGWGGGSNQFFALMKGLAQCGFKSLAFDQLGHGNSELKPASLKQLISTTDFVLHYVNKRTKDGISAVVGHSTGCIAITNSSRTILKDLPLFLVSPVFNYKLYFLKKLVKLKLHSALLKQYANQFTKSYKWEYAKLELGQSLQKYSNVSAIVHDKNDSESPCSYSERFCTTYPLTKLVVTKGYSHTQLITSETVWKELKSHLNYEDTTINFMQTIVKQPSE